MAHSIANTWRGWECLIAKWLLWRLIYRVFFSCLLECFIREGGFDRHFRLPWSPKKRIHGCWTVRRATRRCSARLNLQQLSLDYPRRSLPISMRKGSRRSHQFLYTSLFGWAIPLFRYESSFVLTPSTLRLLSQSFLLVGWVQLTE